MRSIALILLIISHLISYSLFLSAEDYHDPMARSYKLLKLLTLDEKISLIHGDLGPYVGNINSIKRLGIPSLNMQDGPQGFRVTKKTGKLGTSTAWPSSLAMASSWDRQLVYDWASSIAIEFKGKGANLILGPGIGVSRIPTCGRNFEYLSGEDPYLGSILTPFYVNGIQDQSIIACAKHWVNNEQELDRTTMSSDVDERTNFEIYYPPFQAAIDAGVLSAMCSYNKINGIASCENEVSIRSVLRDRLGFQGWLMSDWLATHSTVNSLRSGLDQELPLGVHYSYVAIESALKAGGITVEEIDSSVLRILTAMIAIGLLDNPNSTGTPTANVTSVAHRTLCRKFTSATVILLKNQNQLLPLIQLLPYDYAAAAITPKKPVILAVIGQETPVIGGGSGAVIPVHVVSIADGIRHQVDSNQVTVITDEGKDIAHAVQLALTADIVILLVGCSSSEGKDRNTLSLGLHQDTLVTEIAKVHSQTIVLVRSPGAVLMPWAENVTAILLTIFPGQEVGDAVADILFGRVNPSARLPLSLPHRDNEMEMASQQYPGTGSPKHAIYSEKLLVGYRWYHYHNVTPLFPFGFGLSYSSFIYHNLSLSERGGREQSFTGSNQVISTMSDEKKIEETGRRSQTSSSKETQLIEWQCDNDKNTLKEVVVSISFSVTNHGHYDGSEVCQLYLTFPIHFYEPPRQLRNFTKIFLTVGSTATVTFPLTRRDVSIWNDTVHSWCWGESQRQWYEVYVGGSSADTPLTSHFVI